MRGWIGRRALGWMLIGGALIFGVGGEAVRVHAQGKAARASSVDDLPPQTILPPGLYLFQTRTRDGSCNDAPRTGYVTSAIATLDGVPGSRTMVMQLLNSKYWPTWNLIITAEDAIIGSANMMGSKDDKAGSSRFEMKERKDRDRYQGVGSRNYNATIDGKATRCTLNYDVLLKPLTKS